MLVGLTKTLSHATPVNMSSEKKVQTILVSCQTPRHEETRKEVNYRHTTKACVYVRNDQVYVHTTTHHTTEGLP